jgi:hypothetical protein
MAKPRVPQNLPPESQQWVRDIERRLNDLETENQRLARSVTQNAGQLGALSTALSEAQTALEQIQGAISVHQQEILISATGQQEEIIVDKPSWAKKAYVSSNYSGWVGAPSNGDMWVFATASNSTITAAPDFPGYVPTMFLEYFGAPWYVVERTSTSFVPVDLSSSDSVYIRPYCTVVSGGGMVTTFNHIIFWSADPTV